MPTMAEDRRVKAENIDAMMADGKVFFLDVREPKEIEGREESDTHSLGSYSWARSLVVIF